MQNELEQLRNQSKRQIDYRAMRMIIGAIAFSLPFLVYLLSGDMAKIDSISASYWTDARDVFVGSLMVVAFFLSAYKGSGEGGFNWEYLLSKAACVFAVIVALFPTECTGCSEQPAVWISTISSLLNTEPVFIHRSAAAALFACLVAMIWFFSIRAKRYGKTFRAYGYKVIAIAMVGGFAIMFIFGAMGILKKHILIIETWGLVLWGIGWFWAGNYKPD